MGHAIHKHMSSGQRYDDKQAYNKDLSDSARLHYLENEEHDKGMSRYKEGMSRNASLLNDFKGGYHKVQHAKGEAHKGTSRKSSPANYETAKQERINLNTENPIKKASCKYKK